MAFFGVFPPPAGGQGYLLSFFLFRLLAGYDVPCQSKAGQEDVREPYRKLIENFVYYQDGQMPQGQSKYHSERGSSPKSGHGPCFFDDNIWVARNLLCAYEVFGDSSYIEEAKKCGLYLYSMDWDWAA